MSIETPKKLYIISRVIADGQIHHKAEIIISASSMYSAFNEFKQIVSLHDDLEYDDIGASDNPCIRYIVRGEPDQPQTRYYVKPYKD